MKVRVCTETAACPAHQDLVHKEAARPSEIFSLQLWSSSFCSSCVLLFSPSGLSLPPSLPLPLRSISCMRSVTLCPSAGKDMTDYQAIKYFPCGLHSSRAISTRLKSILWKYPIPTLQNMGNIGPQNRSPRPLHPAKNLLMQSLYG